MFGKKNTNTEILVFVKQEPLDLVFKKKITPSSDGRKAWVEMEPQTKEKAGWRFDVTGCIRPSRQGLYCEVFRGATKAIKIDPSNENFAASKLTNDEAQGLLNMRIFKAHYGQMLKDLLDAIKPILIVLAVVVAVSVALGAVNLYLITKIPAVAVQVQPTSTPPIVIG